MTGLQVEADFMNGRAGRKFRKVSVLATRIRAGARNWLKATAADLRRFLDHDDVFRVVVISAGICSTALLAIALLSM
jgi:hypothetical protein